MFKCFGDVLCSGVVDLGYLLNDDFWTKMTAGLWICSLLLPNFRRKRGHQWSAAPHLRWSARTRVSLTWQVMSYHWNSQGSGDGPGMGRDEKSPGAFQTMISSPSQLVENLIKSPSNNQIPLDHPEIPLNHRGFGF